ncbi:MAG TPA: hypothetical protein VJ991_12860 [Balneolales bacterium]|nr:hypothetical protein [Balneolales bacterium]
MDTLSHAAWGYASLRWHSKKMAWYGALAGAAPDLLFFVPSRIDQTITMGWDKAWSIPHDPAIWQANGPPMPPELMYVYHHYYIYTHSLILLAGGLLFLFLIRKRLWMWLGIPYGLHLLMDFPTHERFLTQLFFPISNWTFQGIRWSDPRIFIPNIILLLITYTMIWWYYHYRLRYTSEQNLNIG